MSINGFKCGAKCAFSLIELMVTIIVIMIIMGSIAPSITKKLNSRSVKVGGTIGTGSPSNIQFEPDCSHINEDCELCTTSACWLCLKVCPVGQYAYTSDCTCQSCSDKYGSECLSCTDKKCKTCSTSHYLENGACTICPTGHYCDGENKIACPEG